MVVPKALVFFDLDGTLLNNKSEVDQEVIVALEKLKENGGVPFIATGRSPIEIQHVLDTTPIESFIESAYNFIHAKTPPVDAEIHLNEEVLMSLILTTDTSVDDQLREAFPELSFYRNTPYSIDVITKGNSKATGIQALVKLMQFDAIPTYAFGDGPNDLEMITHADYSVAMENGIDVLKNAADYVTSSHIEGGIVEGLEFYDLIK